MTLDPLSESLESLLCGWEYIRSFWRFCIAIKIERFFVQALESVFTKEPTSPVPRVEYPSGSHGLRVNDLYVSRSPMGRGVLSVGFAGVSKGLLIEQIAPEAKVKLVFTGEHCALKFIFVGEGAAHGYVSQYVALEK